MYFPATIVKRVEGLGRFKIYVLNSEGKVEYPNPLFKVEGYQDLCSDFDTAVLNLETLAINQPSKLYNGLGLLRIAFNEPTLVAYCKPQTYHLLNILMEVTKGKG